MKEELLERRIMFTIDGENSSFCKIVKSRMQRYVYLHSMSEIFNWALRYDEYEKKYIYIIDILLFQLYLWYSETILFVVLIYH